MAPANVGSTCAKIVAASAVCILAVEPSYGQFFSWPQFTPSWGNHALLRHKHRHRYTKPRSTKKAPAPEGAANKAPAPAAAKGALQIIVSIRDQRISVYEDGALIARSSVSTGVP